jgi:hypothetical protein
LKPSLLECRAASMRTDLPCSFVTRRAELIFEIEVLKIG